MTTVEQPIKLIAIDIDGTLLDPHKRITPRTRAAIQAARAAGIVVTLATARRYSNCKHFATELGIDIPLITYDGALIMQHPQQKVLYTHTMRPELAQEIVDRMVQHNVQPVVQHVNGYAEMTLTGDVGFDTPELAHYFAVFPEVLRVPHDVLGREQQDILRVVAFTSEETIMEILPEITLLPCSFSMLARGNYECAELSVMAPACSKAQALVALAERLQIPLAQVMAIGDNTNDSEMLQTAGWGVAMGQAPDEVKAVADAVTASNGEDGVALAIEHYGLGVARVSR